ncbi:DUF1620-domain-containing protein [Coniochaeta ligniaria NRRL 30616]|uniref:ER membrane protein complex subunit 1 n=1 Tax=Coniochaeta ligniaria NRRL 30616 TaxID=1408157 RepID=A0A1J7ITR8_9PEZI|nr:DUF1620-domain-containing protein [Coniochaeta ligniaria NRRL 30616]
MRPLHLSSLLLGALSVGVHAVFQDEVGHLDYHYELLGVPQRETTFFHRPRREDKASLLYTLSDVGVLGAVHPSSGAVVWRQFLTGNITNGGGFVRASEGENWICSAFGHSVHAWDAVTGRNRFWMDFEGEVKDLEVMEMTEKERKDVLVLFDDNGATVLRRLNGNDGSVVWEFRDASKDVPLQVSTNVEKVFAVSLHGSLGSYNLKVTALDTLTGKRVDEIILGTKGEVNSEKDVTFVGANSAAPVVAWTDDSHSKLRINVLGTKNLQTFPLEADTVSVEVHAPHLIQSQPHFLVHSKTRSGHRADVYHVQLKSDAITKAYELPLLPGQGAFSTASVGANVFFTRITADELILTDSMSHGILGRWPLKTGNYPAHPLHAVSEVIKKSATEYAVRAAMVTDADDWLLVRNGELGWTRPEGMTGAVAATFAEIPKSEDLAKSLEEEAHSNPLTAYIHRVNRHFDDLQYLPDYLAAIPQRLISSILGTDITNKGDKLLRDSFGFHKLVILATRRGRVYALDAGNEGKMLWNTKAVDLAEGETWDVKAIFVDEPSNQLVIQARDGHALVDIDTGKTIEVRGSLSPVQGVAIVDGPDQSVDTLPRRWPLAIYDGGKVDSLPADLAPEGTVVVRGAEGEIKGLKYVIESDEANAYASWIFSPPKGQKIVHVAARPSHDAIASIGRVLGDRTVKYKYLNPNTLVAAAVDEAASTLTVYLLDTVSGEILSSATHEGVDTAKNIECVMAENWFLCTFFGQYTLQTDPGQSIKGYQLVVSDLYESELPNDRGPLGNAANFSSVDPIDSPTAGGPVLPSVITQSFVLGAPISALAVTQTRQGISTRQVLGYLTESHGIVGLPRQLLEPRRPVGRDPSQGEMEEGLMRYHPTVEIDPKMVVTHEREVIGVKKIITSPVVVESTSLVFAFGVDVFGTRVAPSFLFDILGKGFNKLSLIATVVGLGLGVLALAPLVRKKQINTLWQS